MYKDIEIYPIIKASSYSLSKRTSAYRFPPPSLALLAVNPHPQPSLTTPSLALLAVNPHPQPSLTTPSLAPLAVNLHPQPSLTTPSLAPLAVTSKSEGQKQLDDIMAKACDEIVINH